MTDWRALAFDIAGQTPRPERVRFRDIDLAAFRGSMLTPDDVTDFVRRNTPEAE